MRITRPTSKLLRSRGASGSPPRPLKIRCTLSSLSKPRPCRNAASALGSAGGPSQTSLEEEPLC
eukprot:6987305-Lingulodinium_polyedra.AAC.1